MFVSYTKVKGLSEAKRNIEKYKRKLNKACTQVVKDSSRDFARLAQKKAPVDTGKLRAGITYKVTTFKYVFRGTITSTREYSSALEYGTGPRTGKPPPYNKIRKWALRKGISNPYFVYLKIIREGTPEQPYMMPAVKNGKHRFILRAVRRIGRI